MKEDLERMRGDGEENVLLFLFFLQTNKVKTG